MRGATCTLEQMPLHRDDCFPWEEVIDEGDVLISKARQSIGE
jgi:hypothetical protein